MVILPQSVVRNIWHTFGRMNIVLICKERNYQRARTLAIEQKTWVTPHFAVAPEVVHIAGVAVGQPFLVTRNRFGSHRHGTHHTAGIRTDGKNLAAYVGKHCLRCVGVLFHEKNGMNPGWGWRHSRQSVPNE